MRKFDEVTRTLWQINKLLDSHAKYLDNEEQTKLHLIDPILQAVGWNLSDPSIVRREYGVDTKGLKRVDYALFRGTTNINKHAFTTTYTVTLSK